ncbi:hypothetical protein K469DRAFT_689594 [Zopfia rhizophila CBS 207.26]|uniref:Lytic polysaccharide monooxygenase n=1 Tax=Zopfia rhizophila CBS 207.26 TaxID=1314779 RepID=A0A6A6DXS1_9PEZI|nr:hypothetical protein K469DRAFT_689594 [Zopfia rhizophila CBS 207.26]
MKIPIILTALSVFVAFTNAQITAKSVPFRPMTISKDNSTISGTVLGACHEGAATEGLCLFGLITNPSSYSTAFYLNTTIGDGDNTPATFPSGKPGILGWALVSSSFVVPSAMHLVFRPTSNVAIAIISPGNSTFNYVALDEYGYMVIGSGLDETTFPPTYDVKDYRIGTSVRLTIHIPARCCCGLSEGPTPSRRIRPAGRRTSNGSSLTSMFFYIEN